jgi:hypothetical protein
LGYNILSEGEKMGHECNCHGCKPACIGMKMIAVGALLIANQIYFRLNWWILLGGLLILKGLMLVVMKGCMCHMHETKECCCSNELASETAKEKKHAKK